MSHYTLISPHNVTPPRRRKESELLGKEHHGGEEGDVERDRRVVEPAGAMSAEPVGAEIEEDEDGHELEGAGREERRADPHVDAGHGRDEEDGVEEETSGH